MHEINEAVTAFLKKQPLLYAAVTGPDKRPQVHPAELCFESEGALYFAAAKCEAFYAALSLSPAVRLCACDAEGGTVMYLSGKAVFTEEPDIISRCLEEGRLIRTAWGHEPGMVIAWFLKDAVCELVRLKDGSRQVFELGTPDSVLTGIRIKKNKELRDRLTAIMEERERTAPETEGEEKRFLQKLYDGAVLYFAETAKELWPRMDIRPIERSALFDTYDERERFTELAKKLIGNAEIGKPEDMTYWLNRETLREKAAATDSAAPKP